MWKEMYMAPPITELKQNNIKMYRAEKCIIMGTKLNSCTSETTVIIAHYAEVLECWNVPIFAEQH
jgi:hypothetical protein